MSGTNLGRGTEPDWNPSRDQIAFRGCDASGSRCGLWTMCSDGSNRQQVTDVASDSRPEWSPDGTSIVFMSNNRDGNWEIYSVNVSSGNVMRLTNNSANDGLPVYSPDGSMIAFLTNRSASGAWEIQAMPSSGGDATVVTTISGNLPDWLSEAIDWTK